MLIVAGAGLVLWRVLGTGADPSVGVEESPTPSASRPPTPRPELPPDRSLAEKPPPPREGLFVPGEEFPAFGEGFAVSRRVYIPTTGESLTVRGAAVREALLGLPDIYLRWQSEEVKQAFLRAELRLSPDIGMDASEGRPAGAPIPSTLMHLPEFGFRAWVRPPVVRIFAVDAPNPDRPGPR